MQKRSLAQIMQLVSFAALVICLPLGWRYITKYPFAISWINIFSLLFVMVSIAAEALLGVRTTLLRPIKIPKVYRLVLLGIVLATIVGTTQTSPLTDAFGPWTSRFLQPLIVGYFAVRMFDRNPDYLKKLPQIILLSTIIPTLWVLLQFAGAVPFQDMHRATAGYAFATTFARWSMITVLFCAPWVLQQPKKRLAWLIVLTLAVLVLLATQSYNAVVSAAIAGIIGLYLMPSRYKKIKIGFTVFIAIAALLAISFPSKLPKWNLTSTSSIQTREQFWEVARGVIKDNPLKGIGFKTWEHHYLDLRTKYATPPMRLDSSAQPHSFVLDSLVKTGILGLSFPLSIILVGISGVIIARKEDFDGFGWIGVALAMYCVSILLFGLLDDSWWSDDTIVFVYFWFLLAGWRQYKLASKG